MTTPVTCLVTIHGMGFQQAPLPDGTPGYADGLHEHLSGQLGAAFLSDDPNRHRDQSGQNGVIYVQSDWPPGSGQREAGVKRLGTWSDRRQHIVDADQAPLTNGVGRIAHIALVYAQLYDNGPHPGCLLEAGGQALLNRSQYISIASLLRLAWTDLGAAAPSAHDRRGECAAVDHHERDVSEPAGAQGVHQRAGRQ